MSYNFVNNLEITDQPLSLAEMESQGAFKEETTETPENPIIPAVEGPTDGLLTVDLNDTTEETTTSSSNSDVKKNLYQTFVEEFLVENGLDPEELDLSEIKSAKEAKEFIAELYTSERDTQIEEYKNNFLNPLQKKFADLVEQGVTPDDAGKLIVSLKSIEGITEENLYEDKDKAKAIVKEYLKKTTKFSEAKINKEIELKDELGTLEDDAKEFLPELKTIFKQDEAELIQAKQNEEAKRIAEEQAKIKELQDYLESTENIGGFALNKTLKDKWKKEYGLVEVDTPQGKVKVQPIQAARLNNPTEFDALMRLYNTLGLFKYDARKKSFTPDFSALKSLGAKETISEFERALSTEGNKAKFRGGAGMGNTDSDSKEAYIEKFIELSKKLNQNK